MHHLKKKVCKRSPNFKPFLYFIAVKRTISEDNPTVSAESALALPHFCCKEIAGIAGDVCAGKELYRP